jgi:hypothetical protein
VTYGFPSVSCALPPFNWKLGSGGLFIVLPQIQTPFFFPCPSWNNIVTI